MGKIPIEVGSDFSLLPLIRSCGQRCKNANNSLSLGRSITMVVKWPNGRLDQNVHHLYSRANHHHPGSKVPALTRDCCSIFSASVRHLASSWSSVLQEGSPEQKTALAIQRF